MEAPVLVPARFAAVFDLLAFAGIVEASDSLAVPAPLLGPAPMDFCHAVDPSLFLQLHDHDGLVAFWDVQIADHLSLPDLLSWGRQDHIVILPQSSGIVLWVEAFAGVHPGGSVIDVVLVPVAGVLFGKLHQAIEKVENCLVLVGQRVQHWKFFFLVFPNEAEPRTAEEDELKLNESQCTLMGWSSTFFSVPLK